MRLIIFAGSSILSRALFTFELKMSAILLKTFIMVSFCHFVALCWYVNTNAEAVPTLQNRCLKMKKKGFLSVKTEEIQINQE